MIGPDPFSEGTWAPFSHFGPFLLMFSRIFVPSRVLNQFLFDFGSIFGGSGKVLRGFGEGFFNDFVY